MKYLIGIIVGLAMWTGSASAADFSITGFQADITVNSDASINVVETIDVDFPVKQHGLFRHIPYIVDTTADMDTPYPQYVTPIIIQSVTDGAGAAVPYATSQAARDILIRIGDPYRKISGSQRYVITYRAEAAVTFYDDHEELYWNVTGIGWEVPIPASAAVVHLPAGVKAESIRAACYTGEYGSTATNCTIDPATTDVKFSANDFLTIVVGVPLGTIAKPANYDFTRQNVEVTLAEPYSDSFLEGGEIDLNLFTPVRIVLNVLAIIAAVVAAGWLWWTRGRDPAGPGTVVAEYDPPAGLRPAQVGAIIDERVDLKDITATLIDLAVQGYLTIEEVESKKMLGLKKGSDYVFRRTDKTAEPRPFEAAVLDGVFGESKETKLSDLKNEFYTSIPTIRQKLYSGLTTDGYFVKNPEAVRNLWLVIGIVVAGLGFVGLFSLGLFAVPVIGAIIAVLSRTLPQRTSKGVAARQHIRGFKEFLHTAERYRLQWQEREHIFETFLPYAMVLGVAKQWAEAFKDVGLQAPAWYSGGNINSFNSLVLFSSMNSLNSASASTMTSHPASSGSGFGGGGFSGGGGGGGGGGSW